MKARVRGDNGKLGYNIGYIYLCLKYLYYTRLAYMRMHGKLSFDFFFFYALSLITEMKLHVVAKSTIKFFFHFSYAKFSWSTQNVLVLSRILSLATVVQLLSGTESVATRFQASGSSFETPSCVIQLNTLISLNITYVNTLLLHMYCSLSISLLFKLGLFV